MALVAEELIRRTRKGGKVDVQVKFTDTITGRYLKRYLRFPVSPSQSDVDDRTALVRQALVDSERRAENSWNKAASSYLRHAQRTTERTWNLIPQAIIGNPSITAGELATEINSAFPGHILDLTKMLTLILDRTGSSTFSDLKTFLISTQDDIEEH